jgi:hypothetical protein
VADDDFSSGAGPADASGGAELATVADYVADARVLLQDTVQEYRYDDASLVSALNIAMMDVRRWRPDLFLGDLTDTNFGLVGYFDVGEMDALVMIEFMFRPAVVFGMAAHALMRDAEDVQDARAQIFYSTFEYRLTGRVAATQAG